MVFVYAVLGLLILLLAGDALVKGAVNLSLRVGIPALVVSLTIVAFGTSAPELLISIKAALENAPGIALGNVVGSNTANVLLVLGIPALITVMHTSQCDTRSSYLQMLAGTLVFIALGFRGVFDWIAALILLAMLLVILGSQLRGALKHRAEGKADEELEEPEGADPDMPWWRIGLFLALGLIGLPLGADLLVDSAEEIAHMFGVPDAVIGLTLVALGTSLPELATTVMAAIRRQADVAIGNVIGSNLFNLLAIIGVASLIAPIGVGPGFLQFDFWVMLGASLLLVPFVFFGRDLGRVWGVVLSALYVGYVTIVLI
ncbi:calcium/sodium antiporter [Mameliella sediminis]|uniref:calcium/sodium antiporter n=1 Tax=Mameliella sediminis TaxID=2836866 RepID=UPI001C46FDA2|nr:calcium/sodium antiporter [Mameliella sediminis]MBY6115141.1 calcium/sodium antiporter [Antarctobacter heliothermus]MBY6144974.1 calcium/sodium antiporter [Mameliella alba]MBV7396081.1 calcium/sodium antiporter [Mameliella sediminis]MBY6160492.1 calcium/sodium antiporter [Mameliella alba]MBY6168962.1 calcium/sodium antiporter [Mameliella alba]